MSYIAHSNQDKPITVRYATVDAGREWVDAKIRETPIDARSGYVKVDERHFHIASTPAGEIVSLVEWRENKDVAGGVTPVHNLFCVDGDSFDHALRAWRGRLDPRAESRAGSALLAVEDEPHLTAARPAARSGGR